MSDSRFFSNMEVSKASEEAVYSEAVSSLNEDKLFGILDQFMALPPEEFPTEEELKAEYPELAHEIWRCLEGMKLLRKELPSSTSSLKRDFSDSTFSTSCYGTRPETMLEMEPIGDFELVREIARGGMGVVYEAWQESLHRLVALKVLPLASTFDQRQLQRFRNEASAAAQLDHPGIVPIYAIGCERGVHFYAMKLIEGEHLGTIIQALRKERGEIGGTGNESTHFWVQQTLGSAEDSTKKSVPFGSGADGAKVSASQEASVSTRITHLYSDCRGEYFRSAARQMKQAAEALEYAHQYGVIHRDIKPANLMLDVDGKLWITDFGLAQVRSDVRLTQTGEVFGTPRYMSPEQAQGNHRLADHRVDIYSLGATFYEIFTLHPIFSESNHVRLLKSITHDEPKRPTLWDSAIPRDLETILLKCLAKLPEERYESAGELAKDLDRFLENRPIKARRPGFGELAAKWHYRHPRFLMFVSLFFILVWVGTLFSHHLILKEKKKTQIALAEAQARFEKARNAADQLVKIAEENLKSEHSLEIRQAKQKILDTALILYQDFLKIDELDPQTEKQLTAIRNYVQRFMELLSESRGTPSIFLLQNPAVQKELELSEPQKEKIQVFSRDFRKKGEQLFRDSRNFTPEERVNRLLGQLRTTEAFLEEVLTEKQTLRLQQILFQEQPERILDEKVRQELKLTEEQTEALWMAFSQPHYFRFSPEFTKFLRKSEGNVDFTRKNEKRGENITQIQDSSRISNPRRPEPLPREKDNGFGLQGRNEKNPFANPRRPDFLPGKKHYGTSSYGLNTKNRFVESILTQEQLQKWNEMKGEEFWSQRLSHSRDNRPSQLGREPKEGLEAGQNGDSKPPEPIF